MFKRTLVSTLIATTVAATMLAGTVQPSAAHPLHHHHNEIGIGIAAGVGGFVLGSLLAQQQPRTVYADEDGGSWHVRRCFDRYSSYDPDSDTYIGRDGYSHYCRL